MTPQRPKLCGRELNSRSKYAEVATRTCGLPEAHAGDCDEYPYLGHLAKEAPRVRAKIIRDATMTTGAAWASDDAGPNRILRWVMMLPDKDLLSFNIDMTKLKPGVIAKLRDKAADYDTCMAVARKLTYQAYGMSGAPTCPTDIRSQLEPWFGPINPGMTVCHVCWIKLDFSLFSSAQRGKAEIETAHANPRDHSENNVGFAHRECNIAQGTKTLDEFYEWIEGIIQRKNAARDS